MTTPFQPNLGDTIEFYNSEAELWEPGTVFSHGADRRHYFINPDDENQPMHVVNYTNIRPLTDTTPDETPSFWEAAKTFARIGLLLRDLTDRQEREIRSLKERQNSIADERDNWMGQAIANNERAKKLQAQLDAAPYETGAPVGDRVAARIAEYRERAEKAEADRDGWAQEAKDNLYISRMGYDERDKARARVKELEDQNRRLKTVLNLTNDDVTHYRQHSAKLDADLIEARKVAGDCEARAEKAERELETFKQNQTANADAAEARIEELEDQLRIQKSRADAAMNRAREGEGWQHELYELRKALCVLGKQVERR